MKTVFKVLCIEDGLVKNLFRGLEGSRTLPSNKWLKAVKKWGVDGSGQTPYLTGIHCLLDKQKAIDYLDNFRTEKERIIVKCKAKGLRQKPTNEDVYLADEIYFPEEELEKHFK